MLKHVLVPLDGSSLAKAAIDVAARVVDSTCEITLVSVVQEPEYPIYAASPVSINPEYYPTLEMLEKDAKWYLEGIADLLRQRDNQVNTRVDVGEPANCILRVANDHHVDLIVMSTHGRSGVSRLLFGSVTNRVLSQAICPVLVVPSQQTQQQNERKFADMNPA